MLPTRCLILIVNAIQLIKTVFRFVMYLIWYGFIFPYRKKQQGLKTSAREAKDLGIGVWGVDKTAAKWDYSKAGWSQISYRILHRSALLPETDTYICSRICGWPVAASWAKCMVLCYPENSTRWRFSNIRCGSRLAVIPSTIIFAIISIHRTRQYLI